jgi:hypothetical protein
MYTHPHLEMPCMARRTRAQGSPTAGSPESRALATISTQAGEETYTYYSNHAEVAYLAHEFAILFARIPTKLPPDKIEEVMGGNLNLTAEVQILIPTTLINGLIQALTRQKAAYEEQHGAIQNPGGTDAEGSNR